MIPNARYTFTAYFVRTSRSLRKRNMTQRIEADMANRKPTARIGGVSSNPIFMAYQVVPQIQLTRMNASKIVGFIYESTRKGVKTPRLLVCGLIPELKVGGKDWKKRGL